MSKLIPVLLAVLICGCTDSKLKYECSFDRLNGTFHTSDRELRREGSLIIAYGKDGREHALPRNQLQICREF